jgi:PAS domain S-box-containing protein
MDNNSLVNRCHELEEKIRLLTLENDHLADRSEESLLLGLIAEKINDIADVDEMITVGLEQISILKDIPYVACFAIAGDQARYLHSFTHSDETKTNSNPIPMSAELLQTLNSGGCALKGGEQDLFPYVANIDGNFQPVLTILIPLGTQFGQRMLFTFATENDEARLESMNFLLPRVVDMIASRIDNIELLGQLTALNEDLDGKVIERTKELEASENRIRTLFEGASDAFLVFGRNFRFKDVNKVACESLGYSREEMLEMHLHDVAFDLDPEQINWSLEQPPHAEAQALDSLLRRKNGTSFPVEVKFSSMEIEGQDMMLAQARDVSERNRLVEQLNQSQKMEAVGRLAGGIAHDFNNILTAIMGQVDLLRMEHPEESFDMKELDLINQTIRKAAGLTHQLLTFSRKQVMDMQTFDLAETISGMTKMLLRMIDENIEVNIDQNRRPIHVFGDPGRVEQILMNLAINARDAMEGGGVIRISTTRIPREEGFPDCLANGPEGTGWYVMVKVTDTGQGIPPEILGKIFDPFFTTKDVGKGTGLGLATVYGLAKQHNGLVRVHSVVGKGTSFEVVFPEVQGIIRDIPTEETGDYPTGKETILLVEDDSTIRNVLSRIIGKLGYKLLIAFNGEEALKVVERDGGPVDLVITDVIMPKMGGGDLARKMRVRCPGVKIIYLSGYTNDSIGQKDLALPGTRFLQKPVSFPRLAKEIREVLDL